MRLDSQVAVCLMRFGELSWDKDKSKKTYNATINALLLHQPGSLSTLTTEIAKLDANINNIKINSRSSDFFDVSLDP